MVRAFEANLLETLVGGETEALLLLMTGDTFEFGAVEVVRAVTLEARGITTGGLA